MCVVCAHAFVRKLRAVVEWMKFIEMNEKKKQYNTCYYIAACMYCIAYIECVFNSLLLTHIPAAIQNLVILRVYWRGIPIFLVCDFLFHSYWHLSCTGNLFMCKSFEFIYIVNKNLSYFL